MTDRKAALDELLKGIDRDFGKGSAWQLGSAEILDIETISTGSIALDKALGGGIPRGRITEIYGPEGVSKTTVALHAIAAAQKGGGVAAIIDVEHALSPGYAKAVGVDTDNLIVSQPDTAEQAFEIMERLVSSGVVDIIVLDSVAALLSSSEMQGDYGDAQVGRIARLMSQAMRKLVGPIHKNNVAAIFVNQLREKVGIVYGSPEVTSGGKALKYYSSVRLDFRRSDLVKEGTDIVGTEIKAKVVKNKISAPFKLAIFSVVFGEGISREAEIVDLGVDLGLLVKKGAWYALKDGDNIGQGKAKAVEWLRQNPVVAGELETKIREQL